MAITLTFKTGGERTWQEATQTVLREGAIDVLKEDRSHVAGPFHAEQVHLS